MSDERRSPAAMAREQGEGASRHWLWQRLSAILLAPLGAWFLWSVVSLSRGGVSEVRAWIALPLSTALLVLLVAAALLHALIGVQAVIEDYLHRDWRGVALLRACRAAVVVLGAAGLMAIASISLVGG